MPLANAPFQVGEFKFYPFCKGKYVQVIYNAGGVNYITLLGISTTVTKELQVSFAHKPLRIILYHTTSGDVAASSEMNIQLKRPVAAQFPDFEALEILEFGYTAAWFEKPINKVNERCTWSLSLAGTNTDRVRVVIYLEVLD